MEERIAKAVKLVQTLPQQASTLAHRALDRMASSSSPRLLRGRRSRSLDSIETASSTSMTTNNFSITGEAELQTLINVAVYEIHQDPYRGLLSQQQTLETQTPITTPWHACEWGTLPPEPLTVDSSSSASSSAAAAASSLKDPRIVVRQVGHCACPCLKEWTRTQFLNAVTSRKGKRKKRKLDGNKPSTTATVEDDQPPDAIQVGLRPNDDQFCCPCDFNPLCLATLGGVVNDVIQERCQELDTAWQEESVHEKDQNVSATPSAVALSTPATKAIPGTPSSREVAESISSPNQTDQHDIEVLEIDDHGDTVMEDPGTAASALQQEVVVDIDNYTSSEENFSFRDDTKPATSRKIRRRLDNTLEPESGPLPDQDPGEIFTSEEVPQQELSNVQFSAQTSQALQRVRHSKNVDTTSIRSYVYRTLQIQHSAEDRDDGLTLDRYMKILKEWHQRLQFVNPLVDESRLSGDQLSLSIPPGIQNLGATCYLNTQLQCLAQNLTFLNGIFSWQMVNTSHSMNSVMTKLQLLLAQMFLGGDCKLTTLDFSNALGLEHHEQQDPNEFARLLFDRMDESFQQCDNDGDLANLLQRIFHGVTTYETICMTCETASERSEGFMDLNLPIVKRPKEPKKKNITGTIKDAFASMATNSKNVDTDVQYCLDQYTCAEMLDGDNQYHCSTCNCKRDAKRILKLTELPPVLNVQLSRYVFDRVKFVKKKVSEKVLLPMSLEVEQSGGTKKKYLLCAVMRHHGTSAYSGHYTAEAMDWLTGKWFEFNDEAVKLLPEGPSCSFETEERGASEFVKSDGEAVARGDDGKTKTMKPAPSGSQDAYNMYYVEEEYLSTTAASAILQREQLYSTAQQEDGGVLEEVTKQRQSDHSSLSEMCFADGLISDRLHRREAGIRKYMLRSARSLVPHNSQEKHSSAAETSGVWVSTEFLRQYLQCQPDPVIESLLDDDEPVLKNQTLLCPHKCLSPEIARRGKLLSKQMYDSLISLIRGERALLRQESLDTVWKQTINDRVITLQTSLNCQQCSKSYRDELSIKLEIIRHSKDLYHTLGGKIDDNALYYEEGEEPAAGEDESYAYVLSRQSATKFRKQFATVVKSVAKYEGGGTIDFRSRDRPIYEGLGAINISATSIESPSSESDVVDDQKLDKYFNKNITCPHGNCNMMHNGRQVRFGSLDVWRLVKKVFPEAIEHRRKRTVKNGTLDADTSNEGCPICQTEKLSVDNIKNALVAWAKETKEDPWLKDLLDGKRVLSREQLLSNFAHADHGGRFVHKIDIQTWRNAVTTLSSTSRIKGDGREGLKAFVESLAFPSCHKVVLSFEQEAVDKLVASIRSFICREHQLVIKNAVFKEPNYSDCKDPGCGDLANHITVISCDEYKAYISSLANLLYLVEGEPAMDSGTIGSPLVIDRNKAFVKDIRKIVVKHHPLIQKPIVGQKDADNKVLRFFLDGSEKAFTLCPGVCDHETCMKEFAPFMSVIDFKEEDRIESISIDSNTKPAASTKKPIGSIAAEPILVESDLEDNSVGETLDIHIYELKENASQEEALKSLQKVVAVPSEEADTKTVANFLRRSSRKRKSSYPCGVLLNEDTVQVGLHHNFAAIRLLMYEKCSIPLLDRKLFLVMAPENETPQCQEITASSFTSPLPLQEWIYKLREDKPLDNDVDPKKHLLFLHQKEPSGYSAGLHETMMESLLERANLDALNNNNPGSSKQKKNRPSERGFSGTLLHSGAPVPSENLSVEGAAMQSKPKASSTISDEDKQPHLMIIEDSPKQPPKSPSPPPPLSPSPKPQAILSDSDDDDVEAMLTRGRILSSKKRCREGTIVAVSTSAQHIVETESSDDDLDIQDNNSSLEELRATLVEMLIAMVEQPVNQSKIWDSVSWVLQNNPQQSDPTFLADGALAKYWSSGDDGGSDSDVIPVRYLD